jgi:hypothetical protein
MTAKTTLVRASAELMEVVRDLCRFAATSHLLGRTSWADTLIEQCAELLAHRAHSIASRRTDTMGGQGTLEALAPRLIRGTEWTN